MLRRALAALGAFTITIAALAGPAARAEQDPTVLCDVAAHHASERTGVPLSVLRAIALTETGRKRGGALRPWPWTVNMEGAGRWFDAPEEAERYVATHMDRGARSFDVGCFQLNYRWHGEAFASVAAMFEPEANALYAARFLKRLYAEFGDWSLAAGAYHSRTPEFAERYRKRFDRLRAGVDGRPPPDARPAPRPRIAPGGPLIAAAARPIIALSDAAGGARNGSLFPIGPEG